MSPIPMQISLMEKKGKDSWRKFQQKMEEKIITLIGYKPGPVTLAFIAVQNHPFFVGGVMKALEDRYFSFAGWFRVAHKQ